MVERPPTVAPPGRYLGLRYEDLVGDPATALRRVVDFLGLRWDDALMRRAELPHRLFDNPYAHPSAEAAAEALSRHRWPGPPGPQPRSRSPSSSGWPGTS